MGLPQAAGREDEILMYRISATILNKKSMIINKVKSSNPEGCDSI
jgi:hypothetical protein